METPSNVEFINLTPNYEVVGELLARAFVEGVYENNYATPMISLIETIRYLTDTDRDAVGRIIENLRR